MPSRDLGSVYCRGKLPPVGTASTVMTDFSALGWRESSLAEIQGARELAQRAIDFGMSREELADSLLDIARITQRADFSPALRSVSLLKGLDVLHDLDTRKALAVRDSDVSSNFFSRVALEFDSLTTDQRQSGVVATPPILAYDMVKIAALAWLRGQRLGPIPELQQRLSTHLDALKELSWYDPCVGGGVFPIAIALMLKSVGATIDAKALRRILGVDLNPLFVAVTRIRLALVASCNSELRFEEALSVTQETIRVGDSLETHTESHSLFQESGSVESRYDIAIGNPPYVRAERLNRDYKEQLQRAYPSVAGGAVDLYAYFVAHGINALADQGILCYVSPASFQKSRNGARLRGYVSRRAAPIVVFDLDELPVFEGVSLHTSVYALQKGLGPQDVITCHIRELSPRKPLLGAISNASLSAAESVNPKGWRLRTHLEEEAFRVFFESTTPLKEAGYEVLSGIKTGFKRAFEIPQSIANELLEDPRSAPFIRPMLRPVRIERWQPRWDGTYLIVVEQGQELPEQSHVYRHLKRYEAELRARSDTKGHKTWYGLRACDYYDTFAAPKIVFPDISVAPRFSLDLDGMMIPDGAFLIPTSDLLLLGVLNSSFGYTYFREYCNRIGNPDGKGRLRFKKAYVEDFPLPRRMQVHGALAEEIREIVEKFLTEASTEDLQGRLNELVFRLYGVPIHHRPHFMDVPTPVGVVGNAS